MITIQVNENPAPLEAFEVSNSIIDRARLVSARLMVPLIGFVFVAADLLPHTGFDKIRFERQAFDISGVYAPLCHSFLIGKVTEVDRRDVACEIRFCEGPSGVPAFIYGDGSLIPLGSVQGGFEIPGDKWNCNIIIQLYRLTASLIENLEKQQAGGEGQGKPKGSGDVQVVNKIHKVVFGGLKQVEPTVFGKPGRTNNLCVIYASRHLQLQPQTLSSPPPKLRHKPNTNQRLPKSSLNLNRQSLSPQTSQSVLNSSKISKTPHNRKETHLPQTKPPLQTLFNPLLLSHTILLPTPLRQILKPNPHIRLITIHIQFIPRTDI